MSLSFLCSLFMFVGRIMRAEPPDNQYSVCQQYRTGTSSNRRERAACSRSP
jgi:hypothetical protein